MSMCDFGTHADRTRLPGAVAPFMIAASRRGESMYLRKSLKSASSAFCRNTLLQTAMKSVTVNPGNVRFNRSTTSAFNFRSVISNSRNSSSPIRCSIPAVVTCVP